MSALMQPEFPFVDYQRPQGAWNGLALVGEAPGADEVREGRPFVGRSGKLLDQALAEAGIKRGQCLVLNAFRLRPPGNKIGHFFISRKQACEQNIAIDETLGYMGGPACKAEFAGEIRALIAELEARRPAMIVALGRTAFWALTGLTHFTAVAGFTTQARGGLPSPVVPTHHPSYILRNGGSGGQKYQAWLGHFSAPSAVAVRYLAGDDAKT